jgi:hypothetical protein
MQTLERGIAMQMVTLKEAAAALNIPTSRLRKWCSERRIEGARHIGKGQGKARWLVPLDENGRLEVQGKTGSRPVGDDRQ